MEVKEADAGGPALAHCYNIKVHPLGQAVTDRTEISVGQNGSPERNPHTNGEGRNVTQKNQCRKEELTTGTARYLFKKKNNISLSYSKIKYNSQNIQFFKK